MATCVDITYGRAVSTSLSVEANNSGQGKTKRFGREACEGSSQGSEKRSRLVIRPFNPNPSFPRPPSYPFKQSIFIQKASGSTSQDKGNVASTQACKGERKTGRFYYTEVATTPEGEPVMMGTFSVANHSTVIIFYSGASHTFMSKAFV
jgi:hypothetical protein